MAENNEAQYAGPSTPGAPPRSGEPVGEAGMQTPEMSQDARNMAMLCHLLGIAGFFAPLVIWLIERDKHRFVDAHGREAMNYQVSLLVYCVVCSLLLRFSIGPFLFWALTIAHVVQVVAGAIQAHRGRPWRYPIAIPFLG